jgi:hypothetical protein
VKYTLKLSILLSAILLVISGCTDREIHFSGVVVELYDNSILVEVNESDVDKLGRDFVEVKWPFFTTEFAIGDEVHVIYDGDIDNDFPITISVYTPS